MTTQDPQEHVTSVRSHGVETLFYLPVQDDLIQRGIAESRAFYEADLLEDARIRVKPGQLAVDVGANIGNHTLFFAKVCGLTVYAFEPYPKTFQILERNVELNGLGDRVVCSNTGLGSVTGQATIQVMDAKNLGKTMLHRDAEGGHVSQIQRLDDIDLPEPLALLKIDVEGMELEVLRGAEETIRRDKPLLYIEAQTPAFLASVEMLLLGAGYIVLDRFNSTPTYLFVPVEAEEQKTLAIFKRLSELYRDFRLFNDQAATVGKRLESLDQAASRSEQGTKAAIQAAVARLSGDVDKLEQRLADNPATAESLDSLAALLGGLGEKLDILRDTAPSLGEIDAMLSAKLLQRFDVIQESGEEQADRLAKLLEKMPDFKSIEDLVYRNVEKAIGAIVKTGQSQAQAEVKKLRAENEIYRKKIESLITGKSWRYTKVLRQLKSTLLDRKPLDELEPDEFFRKVARKSDKQSRVVRPARLELPIIQMAKTPAAGQGPSAGPPAPIKADFARHNPIELTPANSQVLVALASIPEREAALAKVVACLLPQVDRLCIYLNAYRRVPKFLKRDSKITVATSQEHGDLGDAGKFFWVDGHEGFYFTCDDDIVYCPDYVKRSVAKLEQHGLSAVIGWHGSLIKQPFKDYYQSESRRVFSFEFDRPWDTPVHVLGTGCTAFHTSTLRVRHADFKRANMADVTFALLAQQQKVPLVVVEHAKGDLVAIAEAQDSSINQDSQKDTESAKNTRRMQTRAVARHPTWRTYEWSPIRLLLIGRFHSYKKGGIHKSCRLIARQLEARGHRVHTHDTQEPLEELRGPVDLAWIYPGDPLRPDYATVDEKIRFLQGQGVPVMVNFSYIATPERGDWIAEQLRAYNRDPALPAVFAAVFTESVQEDPALADLADRLIMVPKTIDCQAPGSPPGFLQREGICLGDSSKLSNPAILGGPLKQWVDACRRRLPHVNLYAFKQYSGKDPHPDITYVPYMTGDFGRWLGERRIFVCLNRHLTFEMVACEAQQAGTPVIYRHMPHSLSEYIGPTGIRIRSPEELGETCAWLYNDRAAWEQYHRTSLHNGAAIDVSLHAASLENSLRLAILRARQLHASPSA